MEKVLLGSGARWVGGGGQWCCVVLHLFRLLLLQLGHVEQKVKQEREIGELLRGLSGGVNGIGY